MIDTNTSAGASGSSQGGHTQSGAPATSTTLADLDRQHQANPNTRGISPARDAREAAAGRQPGQQQPGQQQQGDEGQQQPAGDAEIQIGDIKITPDKFKEIMARQGAEDARKLTLPQSPEAYELKTSDTFQPPAGVKFEFNKNDPVLAKARQMAHERGMDQATFSGFLDIYAADRIREMTTINTARNAEIQKLGAMAPQRIDAVKTWAHGTLGSELGGAIEQMLVSERHVRAFEKIIDRVTRQGGTQFSQSGRQQQADPGKIPGYEKMSFEQKRAAQMAQRPATPRNR